jgi:hypothetical protein
VIGGPLLSPSMRLPDGARMCRCRKNRSRVSSTDRREIRLGFMVLPLCGPAVLGCWQAGTNQEADVNSSSQWLMLVSVWCDSNRGTPRPCYFSGALISESKTQALEGGLNCGISYYCNTVWQNWGYRSQRPAKIHETFTFHSWKLYVRRYTGRSTEGQTVVPALRLCYPHRHKSRPSLTI